MPEANPLTSTAANRNPEDPLAQLMSDKPLDIGQQPKTSSLFDEEDALFAQESIFDDRTPSTLSAKQNAQGQPKIEETSTDVDPLNLFGSQTTPDPRHHDDPLGLMMSGAVPLAQPDMPVSQPVAAPSQPKENHQSAPLQQKELHQAAPLQPQENHQPMPDILDTAPVELADLSSSPLFDHTETQVTHDPAFDPQPPLSILNRSLPSLKERKARLITAALPCQHRRRCNARLRPRQKGGCASIRLPRTITAAGPSRVATPVAAMP